MDCRPGGNWRLGSCGGVGGGRRSGRAGRACRVRLQSAMADVDREPEGARPARRRLPDADLLVVGDGVQPVRRATITSALEGLAANGFNGVTVWIGGGADYGSAWTPTYQHKATGQPFWTGTPWASSLGPAWASLDHLVAEAERLGIFVWMSLNGGLGVRRPCRLGGRHQRRHARRRRRRRHSVSIGAECRVARHVRRRDDARRRLRASGSMRSSTACGASSATTGPMPSRRCSRSSSGWRPRRRRPEFGLVATTRQASRSVPSRTITGSMRSRRSDQADEDGTSGASRLRCRIVWRRARR